ncbi:MAG: histidine kinase [Proteobacteria bacterium]|nr:histidine kinase [Pseudomonadota bacterium]
MKLITTLACAALGLAATPAWADSWGVYLGTGPVAGGYGNWGAPRYRPDGDWRVRQVCSGERAHRLEERLGHEMREGEIDPWQARRIHDEIDRIERSQAHECAEGDWRGVMRINGRYDRVAGWIDSAAHGRGW